MSILDRIPTSVLSEQLTQILDGRRVRSALFTTYSFDPGFFELEVLPLLFEQPFDHRERLKRVQLEDALRSVDSIAVYYDRAALSQDAAPAQLDFRRLDVRRETGAFHLKLVLLLVDNSCEEDGDKYVLPSLIVGVLSANLTRSGWWENVEAAHFEEIPHASLSDRISYRRDLIYLLDQLKRSSNPQDDHGALDAIHHFLRDESRRDQLTNVRAHGRWFTRLFWGQAPLDQWLQELNLRGHDWNLEIISPFFDADPEPTVSALIEALEPRETRIYLPENADGSAGATEEIYDTLYQLVYWAKLPGGLLQRSAQHNKETAFPRYVHAKVYRLWNQSGQDLALIGSVNLTRPAHSRAREGNLEAAFLVDLSELGLSRRWWLRRLQEPPENFAEEAESEEADDVTSLIDLSLRYDWTRSELAYRYEGEARDAIEICQSDGPHLHTIERPVHGDWEKLPASMARRMAELLHGSSFLMLRRGKTTWRVLVREEGLSHRPSLLSKLTPEEILRFWSLLTPEQKAAFIEQKLVKEASLEGLAVTPKHLFGTGDSLFDRCAGLYHAFGQLEKHIATALEEGRPEEVVTRVMGAKYDSLPILLERLWNQEDADLVQRYLTFLCAQQLWEDLRRVQRGFVREHRHAARELRRWLERLPEIREQLPFDSDDERNEFLDWYQDEFIRRAKPSEEVT